MCLRALLQLLTFIVNHGCCLSALAVLNRNESRALNVTNMQCLHPLLMTDYGFRIDKSDTRACFVSCCPPSRIAELQAIDPNKYYPIPCGKCIACKANRQKEWSLRLQSEMWTNPLCSFVTLTYNDLNLPDGFPSKKDAQDFIKRFRHLKRDYNIPLDNFKYFLVLELGETTKRPHYHAVFFGVDLRSPVFEPYVATVKDGHPIYSSPILERIWNKGFVTVDFVTPAVINYVTKYVLKTIDDNRLWFIFSRNIGRDFYWQKNDLTAAAKNAYDNGFLSFGNFGNHFKHPVPRFVDRLLRRSHPDYYLDLKEERKRFLNCEKTDKRSAAERVSGFIARHKQEKERRILDNGT